MSYFFWLWILVTLTLTFLIVVIVSYFQSSRILRPTGHKKPPDFYPDFYKLVYETVNFTTKDNITLRGWFIPYNGKSNKTIILLHGWGTNKADVLANTYYLNELGYNLFCFDFRCCGESGGKVSSIGYLETKDFDAAMNFLCTYKADESKKIGIYSISMGASVAIYHTHRYPEIKCLIVAAVFGSYKRIVTRWAWVKRKIPYYPCIPLTLLFVRMKLNNDPEKFSPMYHISKVSPKPIFFIHGSHDNLITAKDARKLFKKALSPKEWWLVAGAGHGKCLDVGGAEYKQKLADFFKSNL